jgi:hypothetical protein
MSLETMILLKTSVHIYFWSFRVLRLKFATRCHCLSLSLSALLMFSMQLNFALSVEQDGRGCICMRVHA